MDRTCNWQVIWDIRDAEGLDYLEKCFLLVVESRGIMKGSWQTAAANMGMKRSTFYDTRQALIEKGLLVALRRPGQGTWYAVSRDNIRGLVPDNAELNGGGPFRDTERIVQNTERPFRDTEPPFRNTTTEVDQEVEQGSTPQGRGRSLRVVGGDNS